jgi:hypothetical protein
MDCAMDEVDELCKVELGVGDGRGMRTGGGGKTLDGIREVGDKIRQFWINEKVSLRNKEEEI